jgi:dolichol-phosphate mannosyltransferase
VRASKYCDAILKLASLVCVRVVCRSSLLFLSVFGGKNKRRGRKKSIIIIALSVSPTLPKKNKKRKNDKRRMPTTRTTTTTSTRKREREGKQNGGGITDGVKYSIIVPTYNEQLNIAMLISLIVEAMEEKGEETASKRKRNQKISSPSTSPTSPPPFYEVIVVDDNSQDQTQQTIRKLQKIEKYRDIVRLKPRKGKLGLGSAYIHGLQFARGEFVIIMDADLSHNPKAIPEFIRKQEEGDYDVVTGTRYLASSSSSRITNSSRSTKDQKIKTEAEEECGVYGWDTRRKLTSRVANYLAHVMLDPGVSDLTGSFRLYRKTTFQALVNSMQSVGYVFQMEIIVRAKKGGFKVAEVPISFVDRVYGSSKLGASEIIGYLKGLVSLFMRV